MRKRTDIGINTTDTCGSCIKNLESGKSIYCPSCNENYCIKCATGGGSSFIGGIFRAILALYTVGISEVIRNERIRCPSCKRNNGLLRV